MVWREDVEIPEITESRKAHVQDEMVLSGREVSGQSRIAREGLQRGT